VISIGHVVNPVIVDQLSDLYVAQPITFETMRRAQAVTGGGVGLFTAQYPEDRSMVPDGFTPTPDLDRSVLDMSFFQEQRKLPLLRDILDRLYEATDAEYLVYTNVDIGLQPHFYVAVRQFIREGYDAFLINRRTISGQYTSIEELPRMYAEKGRKHPGNDCFIFRRDAYPQYDLGNVCIGIDWVGWTLRANMEHFARRFEQFGDEHLTFHIGDRRSWKQERYSDYRHYNGRQVHRVLKRLDINGEA
jgi:hypothetical protein